MEKYKSFVPTQFFNTELEEWVEINESRENWIEDCFWYLERHKSIIEIEKSLIIVTFKSLNNNGRPNSALYKGKLEYSDDYVRNLEAELKELSKDFKFKLKSE